MNEAWNQVLHLAQQGFALIVRILGVVWDWSLGQIVRMLQLPFVSLPLWKQVVYVVVLLAIAYFVIRIARRLFEAALKILGAIVELLATFVERIPDILIAGLIALAGAWVITNIDLTATLQAIHTRWPWIPV